MKRLMAIGMIAFVSMDAGAMPFAQVRPSPKSTNGPALRVRVAQVRGADFTLTGSNVTLGSVPLVAGYHAFKFKKSGSEWMITDRDSGHLIARLHEPQITGDSLRLNLQPLPSKLSLGSRDVIATLDLETYLRGVLPAEMPASWPLEALKAQAIAARTFALFRQAHSTHAGFDLDGDTMDQMFAEGQGTKLTDQAVRETEGVTMADPRGHLFAAYFHADCGGHTEEAKNVWGSGDSMGVAVDAGCPLNPKANWSLRLTNEQLSNRLRQRVLNVSGGERSNAGRWLTLKVNGVAIASNEFRAKLGYNELKSTAFQIERVGDAYLFKGQGFGHGVGLCQWGARQMAKTGSTYKEILAHYYPKAAIRKQLDRHPDLNDKENDGAYNEQAAQFHKESLPRL